MNVVAPPSRSRRCKPRARGPGEFRPTDLVGAFFILGVGFLAAAAAVAILNGLESWTWGRWLALHLAFVGGVSQLILGASQFFAGAFLATDPPPRRLVRAQIGVWNVGTVLLAIAVPIDSAPLIDVATVLLVAALGLYAAGLAEMRRRSLNTAPWATRWYAAGAGFFAVGIVAGALLARAVAWPHGDLLAAHLALNLAGWFGVAIVGTLHTFFPSLTQTQLRLPRLQLWTFVAWIAGVAGLAVGYAGSIDAAAVAGWLALTTAAVMLAANVVGCLLDAPRPLSLAARIVGLAQVFLLAGLIVATAAALDGGPAEALVGSTRAAVGTLLVAGWIGLTVLGSLLRLLAVVIRVREPSRPMPAPNPARDIAIGALAALGVAAVAAGQLGSDGSVSDPAAVLLIAAYVVLGARVAVLAATVVLRARPRL